MKKLLFVLLPFFASPAFADVSINLDAGELVGASGAPMQVDDSYHSLNGSLLLILDLGTGGSADNTLTPGQYVSGTNIVLAAGGFNTNSRLSNETNTVFNIPESVISTVNVGDELALRWFPQITLSQYESGDLSAAGDYFGTYNPAGGNPDGGDTWTLPTDGSLISLKFYTMDSEGGGSQPDSAGVAGMQVIGAAPEPSTCLLLLVGMVALMLRKQRCKSGQS